MPSLKSRRLFFRCYILQKYMIINIIWKGIDNDRKCLSKMFYAQDSVSQKELMVLLLDRFVIYLSVRLSLLFFSRTSCHLKLNNTKLCGLLINVIKIYGYLCGLFCCLRYISSQLSKKSKHAYKLLPRRPKNKLILQNLWHYSIIW